MHLLNILALLALTTSSLLELLDKNRITCEDIQVYETAESSHVEDLFTSINDRLDTFGEIQALCILSELIRLSPEISLVIKKTTPFVLPVFGNMAFNHDASVLLIGGSLIESQRNLFTRYINNGEWINEVRMEDGNLRYLLKDTCTCLDYAQALAHINQGNRLFDHDPSKTLYLNYSDSRQFVKNEMDDFIHLDGSILEVTHLPYGHTVDVVLMEYIGDYVFYGSHDNGFDWNWLRNIKNFLKPNGRFLFEIRKTHSLKEKSFNRLQREQFQCSASENCQKYLNLFENNWSFVKPFVNFEKDYGTISKDFIQLLKNVARDYDFDPLSEDEILNLYMTYRSFFQVPYYFDHSTDFIIPWISERLENSGFRVNQVHDFDSKSDLHLRRIYDTLVFECSISEE